MARDLTIAICTWNRSELLRQTLEQFTKLQIPPGLDWEVLVVDNNSSDRTKQAALAFADRLPLRYVFEPQLGLCRARNRAIEESAAELVAFTDDDVLVYEDWLLNLWRAAQQFPERAAYGGPIEPWWVRQPDPDFAEVFHRLKIGFCGVDHERPIGPLPNELQIFGANMAFRRTAIGTLRFDERFGQVGRNEKRSDESDFILRLRQAGGEVIWVPDMRLRHYVEPQRMTLDYLCRITIGDGRIAARLKSGSPDASGPSVGGVPRWLVRRCVEMRLRAFAHKLAGRRIPWLIALREYCLLRGQIAERWLMTREHRRGAVSR